MPDSALRVLIVDDEAPARHRLRDLLDDCAVTLPITVIGEAQNGREALELLQTASADLVLTDINMPDMDGIELARHLLKVPHPPVVIFTTAFHEHAVQAFEVNAVDYLMKPVRAQRLLSALEKVPRLKPLGAETLAHFTSGLRDLPQFAPPGDVWSYNNAGFGVAGRILEVITGKTIHDALRDLVFAPLDLPHAFTRTGTAMTHRFAVAHRQQKSGQTEVIRPFELPLNVTAGGGAMSLASLLRYAQFHLSGGTGGKVLSPALLQQMRSPLVKKNGTTDEMGLGWHLRRLNGVLTAAQGGTGGGHCLHVQFIPDRDLAFAILTNHAEGWRLVQYVERKILETYEKLALSPNQATGGNRGVSEDMRVHAAPLATQPSLDQYAGTYERPPITSYELRVEGGALRSGKAPGTSYVFYGPDEAYVASEDGTGGLPVLAALGMGI